MKNPESPYLFEREGVPNFGNQRQSDNIWKKLEYKLNLFHAYGGQFREPVKDFEDRHNYGVDGRTVENNCFASAVGILGTGCCQTVPRFLNYVLHNINPTDRLYEINIDPLIVGNREYDSEDAGEFNLALEQDLKECGILSDIPVAEINNYFPLIKLVFDASFGKPEAEYDYDMDYHFIVPHQPVMKEEKLHYNFSERKSYLGGLAFYENKDEMLKNNVDAGIYKADLCFAPNSLMGLKVHTVSPLNSAKIENEKKLILAIRNDQRSENVMGMADHVLRFALAHHFLGG